MPKVILPNLGLIAGMLPGEGGWADAMNVNVVKIDALLKGSFTNFVGTLPGAGTTGDVVILTTDKSINVYYGFWRAIAPKAGMILFNISDGIHYQFNGVDWINWNSVVTATAKDFSLRGINAVIPLDVTASDDTLIDYNELVQEQGAGINASDGGAYAFHCNKSGIYNINSSLFIGNPTLTDITDLSFDLSLIVNGVVELVLDSKTINSSDSVLDFTIGKSINFMLAADDLIQIQLAWDHSDSPGGTEQIEILDATLNVTFIGE